MKIEKISNYVLYAICAVTVLLFLLFFSWGFDNIDPEISADKIAPKMTSTLLWFMYLLGAAMCCLMVWSLFQNSRNSGGGNELAIKGVPGSKITICTVVTTLLVFGIGYAVNFAMGEEPVLAKDGKVLATAGWVVVTDAFMVAIYALSVISVIAVVVAATGIMTNANMKK
ncbi:MAG: hypothetical protein IJ064_05910 [Bacteroidaceae bacterium]|nr:hypothetical protein [Bacteroidaceae bacterium]